MLARTVAAVVAALALGACGGSAGKGIASSASATPASSSTAASASASSGTGAAFTPAPIDWGACSDGAKRAECGTLQVPLDHRDPSGPKVTLALSRLPATGERIGSLLVDPGGPGSSGVDFVEGGGPPFPAELRQRFDIVGFDPRGVGGSQELACGEATNAAFRRLDTTPDDAGELRQLAEGASAIVQDCQQNAGALLPYVGTDDVVRDMDLIRQAVGDEQLSYIGYSYGTLLGLRYAELFPSKVRAIVLDGVVDPTQDFKGFLRGQAEAFDRQLGALLDACPEGGAGCPPGGAAAAYDELARRVETEPLPVSDGRTVGPNELATAAVRVGYDANGGPPLYRALTMGLAGDGRALADLNDSYVDSVHYASYAAVECIDSPHPTGIADYKAFADELIALSPRFGGSLAYELLPCALWPVPPKPVVGPVRAAGAPPILVIGTIGDPATPYASAVKVAADLERSALLTVEGAGHTSGSNRCAQGATSRYLVDLVVPAEGARC